MNDRKNLISLWRRQGYERMPVDIRMTPLCARNYEKYAKSHPVARPHCAYYNALSATNLAPHTQEFFRSLYKQELKGDTHFNDYGVALEAGSAEAQHLRRYYHPLKDAETLEELQRYPYPKYSPKAHFIDKLYTFFLHAKGRFVMGNMQCTV